VTDDPQDLIQGQKGVAPNLRGSVLSLCTEREKLDEVEMVSEISRSVFFLVTHELQQFAEGVVIVEQKDVISSIGQLGERKGEKRGRNKRWVWEER